MRFLGYMSLWARPVRSRGERREVPAHHEELWEQVTVQIQTLEEYEAVSRWNS